MTQGNYSTTEYESIYLKTYVQWKKYFNGVS